MLAIKDTRVVIGLLILLLVFLVALVGLLAFQNFQRVDRVKFGNQTHAVLLTNGTVYFGKLENLGSHYVTLTDIYYVQQRIDKNTKEATNVLVKRGKEWHGPDRMVINVDHVLIIEPVGRDSQVAEMITKMKNE